MRERRPIDSIHHNLTGLYNKALDHGHGLLAYLIQRAIEEAEQVRSERTYPDQPSNQNDLRLARGQTDRER